MTDVKLCGMMRAQDVVYAAALGVRYVGCVFAPGLRHLQAGDAAALFGTLDTGEGPRRVGVFASNDPTTLDAATRVVTLDVLQLHGDPDAAAVSALRGLTGDLPREPGRGLPGRGLPGRGLPGRELWAVVRCVDGRLPLHAAALWDVADAVLLDAHSPGRLGGTGLTLPWQTLAEDVYLSRAEARRPARLIIAGGLTPENVGDAIAALQPDVVDTSSGIESAPGIKDFARMTAFVEAVAAADRAGTDQFRSPRSSK